MPTCHRGNIWAQWDGFGCNLLTSQLIVVWTLNAAIDTFKDLLLNAKGQGGSRMQTNKTELLGSYDKFNYKSYFKIKNQFY